MKHHLTASRRSSLLASGAIALALVAGAARAADEKPAAAAASPAPAGEAVVLFNGKDLAGWRTRDAKAKDQWKVVADAKTDAADPKKLIPAGDANAGGTGTGGVLLLEKSAHGADLVTERDLGSGHYHVEFMVPKGSNSGVYLMGLYEVQVLDSHGKQKLGPGDVGGIYKTAAPTTNAAKPPGEWQTFDVVFAAPRFDKDGKKVADATFVSVKLNGTLIHENVHVKGGTGGELPGGEKKPEGPLMFQGDHGPVAYRNVTFKPMAFREDGAGK